MNVGEITARKRLLAIAALGGTVAGISVDKLFDITKSQLDGVIM